MGRSVSALVGASTMAIVMLAVTAIDVIAKPVLPLPASDYTVRSSCAAPAPAHASCLALQLLPRTAAARSYTHPLVLPRSKPIPPSSEDAAAEGAHGLRPQDLQHAYFPGEAPLAPVSEPQTVAVIDAYNDPNAQADLNTYDEEFGLPECATANGCFTQVNQWGESRNLPFPATIEDLERARTGTTQERLRAEEAEQWAVEIATDIEVVRAICQNCHILLVEANSSSYTNLEAAEATAISLGAEELTNSWGGEEPLNDASVFNHPHTVITASSGDQGYLNWTEAGKNSPSYFQGAVYPASSPHVLAVGGTHLQTGPNGSWTGESVWNNTSGASGGGCSERFQAPAWQLGVRDWTSVGCPETRAVADVSADGDPRTGVAVYDSLPYPTDRATTTVLGWVPIGGTSVSSPIIASMFALVGGAHEANYPAETLYSHLGSSLLHDITTGGNGKCVGLYVSCSGSLSSAYDCGSGSLICTAAIGYDGPTGVGSPNGLGALTSSGSGQGVGQPEPEQLPQESPPRLEGAQEQRPTRSTGETTNGAGQGNTSQTAPQPSSPATTGHTSGTRTGSANRSTRITSLALRARSARLINTLRASIDQIGFRFRSTQGSSVLVRLRRQRLLGGHWRWGTVVRRMRLTARSGPNSGVLRLAHALRRGRYLLTVLPAHGSDRSIVFRVP